VIVKNASEEQSCTYFQATIEYDPGALELVNIELGEHAAAAGWTLDAFVDPPLASACDPGRRLFVASVAGLEPVSLSDVGSAIFFVPSFRVLNTVRSPVKFSCACAENGGLWRSFIRTGPPAADHCWGDGTWINGGLNLPPTGPVGVQPETWGRVRALYR